MLFKSVTHPRVGFLSLWDQDLSEQLNLGTGIVFGVPIPEEHTKDGDVIQGAVNQAVEESIQQKINQRGKEVTPWLLDRVNQLTSGKSVTASKCISAETRVFGTDRCCSFRHSSHSKQCDDGREDCERVSQFGLPTIITSSCQSNQCQCVSSFSSCPLASTSRSSWSNDLTENVDRSR